MQTTYRLTSLVDRNAVGQTAATPELAKLVPGGLPRSERLGVEQTDWIENFDRPKAVRSILIEAEDFPGQWELGPSRQVAL
jgi:hypothetical protein